MDVKTSDGRELGRVDEISFDERTGELNSLFLDDGGTARAIVGSVEIPMELMVGYKNGVLVVQPEAAQLLPTGGLAAKAGEATAKIGAGAKEGAKKAGQAASKAVDKGSYGLGKLIGRAKRSVTGAVDGFRQEMPAEKPAPKASSGSAAKAGGAKASTAKASGGAKASTASKGSAAKAASGTAKPAASGKAGAAKSGTSSKASAAKSVLREVRLDRQVIFRQVRLDHQVGGQGRERPHEGRRLDVLGLQEGVRQSEQGQIGGRQGQMGCVRGDAPRRSGDAPLPGTPAAGHHVYGVRRVGRGCLRLPPEGDPSRDVRRSRARRMRDSEKVLVI